MRPARRIFAAIRPALPARTLIVIALVPLVFCEMFRAFEGARGAAEMAQLQGWVLVGLALLHGATRVLRRHPAVRGGYSAWLATTPWHHGRPLPLGPVHPYWADAVVLGAIYLVAVRATLADPLLPLAAFVFGYSLALTVTNALAHAGAFAYAGAILLAIAVSNAAASLPVALSLTTAAFVVGLLGLGVSLDRFPWDQTERARTWPQRFARNARDNAWITWPYTRIGPTHLTDPRKDAPAHDTPLPAPIARLGSVAHAVVCALPIAVWVWAIGGTYLHPNPERGETFGWTWFVIGGLCALISAWSLSAAVKDYKPPVSFWARFFTGRLIIPRYDAVALGPVATCVVAVALPPALATAGVAPPLVFAFTVMLAAAAHAAFAVDTEHWRLTAPCRIEPAKPKQPANTAVPDVMHADVRQLAHRYTQSQS